MQIITDINAFSSTGAAATIGFFDGVHTGHRFLIEQLKRMGLQTLLITFDEHPRYALGQDFQPKLLNTFDEKMQLLSQTGVDACCVLPFTKELSQMSSYAFMEKILRDKLHVRKLLVGHDHRFGHNRQTGFEEYCQEGQLLGIQIVENGEWRMENGGVSSSAVRRALESGNIRDSNRYLGYPYFLSGKVVRGNQIGRTIGFPTANLQPDERKQLPATGVYAVKVSRGKARPYPCPYPPYKTGKPYPQPHEEEMKGMLNIGFRPTMNDRIAKPTIEVHIFDFNQDIYGETITITFIGKIRNEIKFDNLSQLTQQLNKDKALCYK